MFFCRFSWRGCGPGLSLWNISLTLSVSLDDKTRDFEDFLLMASSTHTTRQGRVSLGFSCWYYIRGEPLFLSNILYHNIILGEKLFKNCNKKKFLIYYFYYVLNFLRFYNRIFYSFTRMYVWCVSCCIELLIKIHI